MSQQEIGNNPPRILVVEDDADLREVLSIYLKQKGYAVFEVANGRQALETAQQSIPDLIIMDLAMPVLDGHAAAVQIRQQHSLQKTPIIFMTAYGLRGIDLFSEHDRPLLEPFDYLPKPIEDYSQLSELIESLRARS